MSADVRKSFVFKSSVAKHLEELVRIEHRTQTTWIQEMIEERYKEIEKRKRLEAARRIIGSGTGLWGDQSLQKIKAEQDV
jgi:electron transfer flavoprotein alpha subunit